MIVPRLKVVLYKKISDTQWSTEGEDVTDMINFNLGDTLTAEKDTFTLDLHNNANYDGTSVFTYSKSLQEIFLDIDDRVLIYQWNHPLAGDLEDELIFDGYIKAFNYSNKNKGSVLRVKGSNWTEHFLSALVPATFKSEDGETSATAILKLVKRVKVWNQGKKLEADLVSNGGHIQDTKDNGSALKTIEYVQNMKPLYEQVKDLSSPEYTGDDDAGAYVFKIKSEVVGGENTNVLYWNSRSFTVTGSLVEGLDFGEATFNRKISDVFNALIINAGQDAFGNGIVTFVYNPDSAIKVGLKWKYFPMVKHGGGTWIQSEQNANPDDFGKDTDDFRRYPYHALGSLGSYTCRFNEVKEDYSGEESYAWVVNSAKEFNVAIRRKTIFEAKKEGRNLVDRAGSPKWEVKVSTFVPRNDIETGDFISIDSKTIGKSLSLSDDPLYLRVSKVEQKFSNQSVSTDITLKQDEDSLLKRAGF